MAGKLFIISAPSGAGKTTLTHAVIKQLCLAHTIKRVITYTTKVPRAEEQNGRDYHFVTVEDFEAKAKQGFFLEYSGAYDHYYGTPCSILDDMAKGVSFILVIDRAGARQIMEHHRYVVPIWIYTKNIQVLRKRLLARGTNTPEQIERRLGLAERELQQEQKKALYKHHILNDLFDDAVQKLMEIVKKELKKTN